MFSASHLHPMVVHFPIAIIMTGFAIDFLGVVFRKGKNMLRAGYYLEVIGMATVIAAWGSGYFFTQPLDGEAGLLRDIHQRYATWTLVTIILATLFRMVLVYVKKDETPLKYLALALFFLSFLFVGFTGYLGGKLVMDYLVGL